MRKFLMIEGMSCGHCTLHVKSALMDVEGVDSVDVDLEKSRAIVEGQTLNNTALSKAVFKAGYRVSEIIGK